MTRVAVAAIARRSLLVFALLTVVVGFPERKASASCFDPVVQVAPATARPGQTVTVSGQWFLTCNDVLMEGETPLVPAPLTGLRILLTQGRNDVSLGRVDAQANADFSFTTSVALPMSAQGGTAAIRVFTTAPLPLPLAEAALMVEGRLSPGPGGSGLLPPAMLLGVAGLLGLAARLGRRSARLD